MNGNNIGVSPKDVVEYQARLIAMRESVKAKNFRPSKNMEEHKQLEKTIMERQTALLDEIDRSNMSLQDKISTANETVAVFQKMSHDDLIQLQQKAKVAKQQMLSLHKNINKKLQSEILSPQDKKEIEEYKKRKKEKERAFYACLVLFIIFAVLTAGICAIFLSDLLKKKQQEEYTDSEYKKLEDIMNNDEAKGRNVSNNWLNETHAKELLGDADSVYTNIDTGTKMQHFSLTKDGTTTYYKYDKTTDTLMSCSTKDGKYVTTSDGTNFLANRFANHGGITLKDTEGVEKVVKVGSDTYTLDYNTDNIKFNDKTYVRYTNGEPFFVKAYNDKRKWIALAGLAPTLAFGIATTVTGIQKNHDFGDDKKKKAKINQNDIYQAKKEEMMAAFHAQTNGYQDENNSYLGMIGSDTGKQYAAAMNRLIELSHSYNAFGQRTSMNNGDVTDLDVANIANGAGLGDI